MNLKKIYTTSSLIIFNTLLLGIAIFLLYKFFYSNLEEEISSQKQIATFYSKFENKKNKTTYKHRVNIDNYREVSTEDANHLIDELESYIKSSQWQIDNFTGLPINNAFSGKYLNVNKLGHRTPNVIHDLDSNKETITIWMFGGSTTFGWGLPDNLILSEQLYKELLKINSNYNYVVKNFGNPYYNSLYESNQYISYLKQYNSKPDFVIFLDGLNDGTAFVKLKNPNILSEHLTTAYNYYRANAYSKKPLSSSINNKQIVVSNFSKSSHEYILNNSISYKDISLEAIKLTKKNWELIINVSNSLQIYPLIFLQPISPYSIENMQEPLKTYYAGLASLNNNKHIYDLSSVFKKIKSNKRGEIVKSNYENEEFPVSMDGGHYTSKAIRTIAIEMANNLTKSLPFQQKQKQNNHCFAQLKHDNNFQKLIKSKNSTKIIETITLFTSENQNDSLNWVTNKSKIDNSKKGINFTSQIYKKFKLPLGTNSINSNIEIKSYRDHSAVLCDLIFYKDNIEIKRDTKSINIVNSLFHGILYFEYEIPKGSDELLIINRPWREQDGSIEVIKATINFLAQDNGHDN
jgi:hypothetical protein